MRLIGLNLFAALCLISCQESTVLDVSSGWPDGLEPVGYGFPEQGSPCRQLGESPAVAQFANQTSMLIACPSQTASSTLERIKSLWGGEEVTRYEGFMIFRIELE